MIALLLLIFNCFFYKPIRAKSVENNDITLFLNSKSTKEALIVLENGDLPCAITIFNIYGKEVAKKFATKIIELSIKRVLFGRAKKKIFSYLSYSESSKSRDFSFIERETYKVAFKHLDRVIALSYRYYLSLIGHSIIEQSSFTKLFLDNYAYILLWLWCELNNKANAGDYKIGSYQLRKVVEFATIYDKIDRQKYREEQQFNEKLEYSLLNAIIRSSKVSLRKNLSSYVIK